MPRSRSDTELRRPRWRRLSPAALWSQARSRWIGLSGGPRGYPSAPGVRAAPALGVLPRARFGWRCSAPEQAPAATLLADPSGPAASPRSCSACPLADSSADCRAAADHACCLLRMPREQGCRRDPAHDPREDRRVPPPSRGQADRLAGRAAASRARSGPDDPALVRRETLIPRSGWRTGAPLLRCSQPNGCRTAGHLYCFGARRSDRARGDPTHHTARVWATVLPLHAFINATRKI